MEDGEPHTVKARTGAPRSAPPGGSAARPGLSRGAPPGATFTDSLPPPWLHRGTALAEPGEEVGKDQHLVQLLQHSARPIPARL